MKKISIIVPIYNTGNALSRCLNSIKKQTYSNFECLLINDGGKDIKTKSIVKKYCLIDKRFIFFDEKINQGIEKTRIKGIKHSKGDFIVFSDHDDYYEKNAFEKLVHCAIEKNADIVVSNYFWRPFNFIKYRKRKKDIKDNLIIGRETFIKEFYDNFFGINRFAVSTWAKIYRKNVFENIEIKSLGYNFFEDVIFNIQVFDNANKVCFINDFLYTHVYGGLSSKFDPIIVLNGYEKAYDFKIRYLEKNNSIKNKKFILLELKNVLNHMCLKMVENKYDFQEFSTIINDYKKTSTYNELLKNKIEDKKLSLIKNDKLKELYNVLKKEVNKSFFKNIIKKLIK